MIRHGKQLLLGLAILGVAIAAIAWLVANGPALLRPPGYSPEAGPGAGAGPSGAGGSVVFELAVDSLARGALRLPQPGFRGRQGDVLDVGAVTPVSGLVLVLPPALRPPSPEDGARTMTITLLRDGREAGTRQSRFYAIGDAIRLRPAERLEEGEYDLRFALAPVATGERPIVWFFRLRVR